MKLKQAFDYSTMEVIIEIPPVNKEYTGVAGVAESRVNPNESDITLTRLVAATSSEQSETISSVTVSQGTGWDNTVLTFRLSASFVVDDILNFSIANFKNPPVMKSLTDFRAYVVNYDPNGTYGALCSNKCQVQPFGSTTLSNKTTKEAKLTGATIEITEGQGNPGFPDNTYQLAFTTTNEVNEKTIVKIHPVSASFLPDSQAKLELECIEPICSGYAEQPTLLITEESVIEIIGLFD